MLESETIGCVYHFSLVLAGPTSDVNEQPMLKKRRIEDGKP